MTFKEVINDIVDGKMVRSKSWPKGRFIELKKGSLISVNASKEILPFNITSEFVKKDFEVILTAEEKETLRAKKDKKHKKLKKPDAQ